MGPHFSQQAALTDPGLPVARAVKRCGHQRAARSCIGQTVIVGVRVVGELARPRKRLGSLAGTAGNIR